MAGALPTITFRPDGSQRGPSFPAPAGPLASGRSVAIADRSDLLDYFAGNYEGGIVAGDELLCDPDGDYGTNQILCELRTPNILYPIVIRSSDPEAACLLSGSGDRYGWLFKDAYGVELLGWEIRNFIDVEVRMGGVGRNSTFPGSESIRCAWLRLHNSTQEGYKAAASTDVTLEWSEIYNTGVGNSQANPYGEMVYLGSGGEPWFGNSGATIRGNYLHDNHIGEAIDVKGGNTDVLIEDNYCVNVHVNSQAAITLYANGGPNQTDYDMGGVDPNIICRRNVIDGVVAENNDGAGIMTSQPWGIVIESNLIMGCESEAVMLEYNPNAAMGPARNAGGVLTVIRSNTSWGNAIGGGSEFTQNGVGQDTPTIPAVTFAANITEDGSKSSYVPASTDEFVRPVDTPAGLVPIIGSPILINSPSGAATLDLHAAAMGTAVGAIGDGAPPTPPANGVTVTAAETGTAMPAKIPAGAATGELCLVFIVANGAASTPPNLDDLTAPANWATIWDVLGPDFRGQNAAFRTIVQASGARAAGTSHTWTSSSDYLRWVSVSLAGVDPAQYIQSLGGFSHGYTAAGGVIQAASPGTAQLGDMAIWVATMLDHIGSTPTSATGNPTTTNYAAGGISDYHRLFVSTETRDPEGVVEPFGWTLGDGTNWTSRAVLIRAIPAGTPGTEAIAVTTAEAEIVSPEAVTVAYGGQSVHVLPAAGLLEAPYTPDLQAGTDIIVDEPGVFGLYAFTPVVETAADETVVFPTIVIDADHTNPITNGTRIWTRLSEGCRIVDTITTTYGRDSDRSPIAPGQAAITLEGDARRFDPETRPELKPRQWIRAVAAIGGQEFPLFAGILDGWPQTHGGRRVDVSLDVADALTVLAQTPLPASAYDAYVAGLGPVASYDWNDRSHIARDISGNDNHAEYGTYRPAAGATAASYRRNRYAAANTGDPVIPFAATPSYDLGAQRSEVMGTTLGGAVNDYPQIRLPAGATVNAGDWSICGWFRTGSTFDETTGRAKRQPIWTQGDPSDRHIGVWVNADGLLTVAIYGEGFTQILSDRTVVRVDDLKPHMWSVCNYDGNGGPDARIDLYLDGELSAQVIYPAAPTPSFATDYGPALFGLDHTGGAFVGQAGAVAFFDRTLGGLEIAEAYAAGAYGVARSAAEPIEAVTTAELAEAVLAAAGWPGGTDITGTTLVTPRIYDGASVLEYLQILANSEGAAVYQAPDETLVMSGRYYASTTVDLEIADDGTGDIRPAPFVVANSAGAVINHHRTTFGPTGEGIREASDAASITAYGFRGEELETAITDPKLARDVNREALERHKAPKVAPASVTVNLVTEAHFMKVLAMGIGSRVELRRTPPGSGTESQWFATVEAITHNIEPDGTKWETTLALSTNPLPFRWDISDYDGADTFTVN